MAIIKAHGYVYINNDMQRVSSKEKTGFHSTVSMKELPLPKRSRDLLWGCSADFILLLKNTVHILLGKHGKQGLYNNERRAFCFDDNMAINQRK